MRAESPSRRALFAGFFMIGIFGFGGVLPMARRMMVEERGWLGPDEFNELFALCQSLPGANVTNLSAVFGMHHKGVTGAAAALAGLLAGPMVIVMGLSGLYARYASLPPVRHALAGLAAAAAGLVLGTAGRIAAPVLRRRRNAAVALAVLLMVLGLHLSLPLTLALVLPFSFHLSWRAAS